MSTEVADLRRQLQQAQEERNHWKANHDKQVSNKRVTAAKRDEFKAERDFEGVAEERMSTAYTRLSFYARALNRQSDTQTERAEAEETLVAELGAVMTEHCDVVDLEDMSGSLRRGFVAAETSLAEQRALAEERRLAGEWLKWALGEYAPGIDPGETVGHYYYAACACLRPAEAQEEGDAKHT